MDQNEQARLDGAVEISYQDLVAVLKKSIIGILVTAMLCGVAMWCYSSFAITKQYSAKAQLYVVSSTNSVVNLSDLQLGASLTSDYMTLMTGREFIKAVISDLGLEETYSVGAVQSMISISNPTDTRILNITVTCGDPVLAADIANSLAYTSTDRLTTIMETSRPKVTEEAIASYSYVSPNISRNAVLGFVVGAVAFYGIALLRYFTDDRIRSIEDIERSVGINVLTVVNDVSTGSAAKYGYGYGSCGRSGKKKKNSGR